jgi:regulator of cell morphogenesis and NO signaling
MITGKDKLSDVIGRNIDLLPIVHRLGLSAGIGENNISHLCKTRGLDTRFILGVLNTFSTDDYLPNPDDLELKPLIDFLTRTHEYHKNVTIPRLYALMERMKQLMPDERLPVVVEQYLRQYIEKLIRHIDYEEDEIFPLVEKKTGLPPGTAVNNLKKLFRQHTNVENEISDLKTIIIRHIPGDVDMTLIHDLLHTLSHFEKEQVDHARFEDKILIPKLIDLLEH